MIATDVDHGDSQIFVVFLMLLTVLRLIPMVVTASIQAMLPINASNDVDTEVKLTIPRHSSSEVVLVQLVSEFGDHHHRHQ